MCAKWPTALLCVLTEKRLFTQHQITDIYAISHGTGNWPYSKELVRDFICPAFFFYKLCAPRHYYYVFALAISYFPLSFSACLLTPRSNQFSDLSSHKLVLPHHAFFLFICLSLVFRLLFSSTSPLSFLWNSSLKILQLTRACWITTYISQEIYK